MIFVSRFKCSNYRVLGGKQVQQKNNISNELIVIVSYVLRQLEQIAPVVVIAGNHDMLDAYEDVFSFVVDIYSEKVEEWKRKHPISAMIMYIMHKRRLQRFREMTAEIRRTWV